MDYSQESDAWLLSNPIYHFGYAILEPRGRSRWFNSLTRESCTNCIKGRKFSEHRVMWKWIDPWKRLVSFAIWLGQLVALLANERQLQVSWGELSFCWKEKIRERGWCSMSWVRAQCLCHYNRPLMHSMPKDIRIILGSGHLVEAVVNFLCNGIHRE